MRKRNAWGWGYCVLLCAVVAGCGPTTGNGPNHDGGESLGEDGGAVCTRADGLCGGLGAACAESLDCLSGHCTDGVCCDSACGDGVNDCQGCSSDLTGLANGTCAPMPGGTLCRASLGACDLAEACDGEAFVCPADAFLPSGIPCRSAEGMCDVVERCTGTSPTCPADGFKPATTQCRAAVGPCDVADFCPGTSGECADGVRASGFVCGPSSGEPCDTADLCNGVTKDCEAIYLADVQCRPSSGRCDIAEYCSGAAPTCPPNQVMAAGLVCRASVNLSCDPTESCDGVSAQCPANIESCP